MKKVLYILFLFLIPIMGIDQARVFINSGYIVMGISGTATKVNPTYFIVHNPASNAITQTSGGIVSEKEWGMLWWDIGTSAASYTVPFSYTDGTSLPLTVDASLGAGIGNGTILFSSWHGTAINCFSGASNPADNACYEPSDVTNMYPATSISSPTATDDSYYAVDRFWVIDASIGYTTKPSPEITFSYINTGANSEIAAPNVLTEANLIPQRFNSSLNTWGDWIGGNQTVSGVGGGVGAVSMAVKVPATKFFRSWTLSDSKAPMPIELISFSATCDSGNASIEWSSATESNNNHYTIEKTNDGINYKTVAVVNGVGTSSTVTNYSFTDRNPLIGTSYYRLSQTDNDGTTTILKEITFTGCENAANTIEAYAANGVITVNANSVTTDNYTITLLTVLGQALLTENHPIAIGDNSIKIRSDVSEGIYILNVKSDKVDYNKKLFIGR